jgi:hypothetical protein
MEKINANGKYSFCLYFIESHVLKMSNIDMVNMGFSTRSKKLIGRTYFS